MFQNSLANNNCDCNDYSLLTANTHISIINHTNPKLNGTGNGQLVIAAGANGTIVRSIIIKAVNPVTTGMVRLFVQGLIGLSRYLYKEVPIPATPVLPATPVPYPVLTTFEITLAGGLKLQSGESLWASTQNAEVFNIIVEGLDWAYPETIPGNCCNFVQETANTGLQVISYPNTNTDGSGTILPVFTAGAPANGSLVKAITIKALQNTHEGAVRLFISTDGRTWALMREVWVPETTQSAYDPSFKQVVEMDFYLKSRYIIGASTQNAESFAITVEAIDWTYPI